MRRLRDPAQLVAVVHRTGQAFGIVLDPRPMSDAEQVRHARTMGARCADSASAQAAHLAHRHRSDVTVAELVHHPGQVRTAGPRTRVYPDRTHYRVLVRVTIGVDGLEQEGEAA